MSNYDMRQRGVQRLLPRRYPTAGLMTWQGRGGALQGFPELLRTQCELELALLRLA